MTTPIPPAFPLLYANQVRAAIGVHDVVLTLQVRQGVKLPTTLAQVAMPLQAAAALMEELGAVLRAYITGQGPESDGESHTRYGQIRAQSEKVHDLLALGVSQRQVAKQCGFSQAALSIFLRKELEQERAQRRRDGVS